MPTAGFFVAGTDTDVGKTFVSQALLLSAINKGRSCIAFKPVSAGCVNTVNGLRNEDALILRSLSTFDLAYEDVNPIAFEDPVAPHLAAKKVGINIKMSSIVEGYNKLLARDADVLLVEGAGGWRLPLGDRAYLSDFVIQQQLPVILVVGLKLGCLNHALLTAQTIEGDGLELAGWVANQVDPHMSYLEENVEDLKQQLDAPCLGVIPRLNEAQEAVPLLRSNLLF